MPFINIFFYYIILLWELLGLICSLINEGEGSAKALEQISEQVLVDRAKNGDPDAFNELVLRYEKQVYNLTYRMMGNPEDASDLSQEGFLRIYRSLSRFRGESLFSTWVYRIVSNTCLDELRKRKNYKIQSFDETFVPGQEEPRLALSNFGESPEAVIEQRETQQEIHKAITQLSEEYRLAVILRDIQGLSYEEMATTLSCSIGTVKSRINRGRKKLKEELQKEYHSSLGRNKIDSIRKGG